MPQTSRFIFPPKTRCDLLAGSGVIPFFTHEREAAVYTALWGKVCPADVGPSGCAHVLTFGIPPS